jgi:hypothetical protein
MCLYQFNQARRMLYRHLFLFLVLGLFIILILLQMEGRCRA